jgi:flavin-dependent dehydrogenase
MPKLGDHGVVGASMGGLLAARVLADAYRRVMIVDRDPLPESGSVRKGVPQGFARAGASSAMLVAGSSGGRDE